MGTHHHAYAQFSQCNLDDTKSAFPTHAYCVENANFHAKNNAVILLVAEYISSKQNLCPYSGLLHMGCMCMSFFDLIDLI